MYFILTCSLRYTTYSLYWRTLFWSPRHNLPIGAETPSLHVWGYNILHQINRTNKQKNTYRPSLWNLYPISLFQKLIRSSTSRRPRVWDDPTRVWGRGCSRARLRTAAQDPVWCDDGDIGVMCDVVWWCVWRWWCVVIDGVYAFCVFCFASFNSVC